MPKSLIMIGIGKPPKMPPRFGGARREDDIEQQASAYKPAPPTGADDYESPAYEQSMHDLKQGAKFPPENVNYHTSTDQCDGCHHWDAGPQSCKVVAMATDPGGWCSLFPGEYAEHELTEQPGVEEEEPGIEGSEGEAA